MIPQQSEVLFPLLELVEEEPLPPHSAYDLLAERFHLTQEERRRLTAGGKSYWGRHVRWVREKAKRLGYVASEGTLWTLTERGKGFLLKARPGVVLVVFETPSGVALGAYAEAALGVIDRGSVNLVVTSPPYPLNAKKAYGNAAAEKYIDWLMPIARQVYDTLAEDGSFVLNIGNVWEHGQPTQSLYPFDLVPRICREAGFHLAQTLIWNQPSRLPSPAAWVTVRRVRVTDNFEWLFWLSKSANPKADNRKVLQEYSEAQRRLQEKGWKAAHRPSGHNLTGDMAKDNGGAIARAVMTVANTGSRGRYFDWVKAHSLPIHPARFPEAIPEFFIKMLTDEGDLVVDPFGGSLTTASVAERLNRRWISIDPVIDYLMGGLGRFENAWA